LKSQVGEGMAQNRFGKMPVFRGPNAGFFTQLWPR